MKKNNKLDNYRTISNYHKHKYINLYINFSVRIFQLTDAKPKAYCGMVREFHKSNIHKKNEISYDVN